MDSVKRLSAVQCIILAAGLAAKANIDLFQSLVFAREDVFDDELKLRLILTCLAEDLDPASYTPFLSAVAQRNHDGLLEYAEIDTSSVTELSDKEARSQVKRLRLLRLDHDSLPSGSLEDPLTAFLLHRAHRIEAQTGLFSLVPSLLEPFLQHAQHVRDFYVGTVLPLYRLDYEYHPQELPMRTLDHFEQLEGYAAVDALLSKSHLDSSDMDETTSEIGQDLRGIVAPWVYGRRRWTPAENRRKRRKLDDTDASARQAEAGLSNTTGDWQHVNKWILAKAQRHLPFAVQAVEAWGGPQDVDFGHEETLRQNYEMQEDERWRLQANYCQAAFAAIYAAEADTAQTIDCAHSMLVRLAELLEFEPPPELATSVRLLPRIDHHTEPLERTATDFVQPDALLRQDNPLTMPKLETFSLLQMLVYSAYLLSSLGLSLSVLRVAKLRFWSDESEQLKLLQRILDGLLVNTRRDQRQWMHDRDVIRWLWDWALEEQMPESGYGIFGKIRPDVLEQQLLRALCMASQYDLVVQVYLLPDSEPPLSPSTVEQVMINLALQYYDEASNGNRTRGSMKKASDLIAAFRTQFADSAGLQRLMNLIAATHAMSFYSLTLQRGIPFKPASIRATEDPMALLAALLEQNPRSYAQLDNIIEIGRNLVKARPIDDTDGNDGTDEAQNSLDAERRVISMAIEAALREDDFETAYSYVMNRLSVTQHTQNNQTDDAVDDVSWRAAYLAGRQRAVITKAAASSSSTSPQVRRLEQRMELLSQSLLLAPPTALPEVLAAWRRCEEELLALLAKESEALDDFDDRADRRETNLPGSFGGLDRTFMVQPKRKELGRGTAEEAPMGLFEVARGAAAAFSRTAARQNANGVGQGQAERVEEIEDHAGRQRKRDIIADAVTGSMVSSIGWVLGAKPTAENDG